MENRKLYVTATDTFMSGVAQAVKKVKSLLYVTIGNKWTGCAATWNQKAKK